MNDVLKEDKVVNSLVEVTNELMKVMEREYEEQYAYPDEIFALKPKGDKGHECGAFAAFLRDGSKEDVLHCFQGNICEECGQTYYKKGERVHIEDVLDHPDFEEL